MAAADRIDKDTDYNYLIDDLPSISNFQDILKLTKNHSMLEIPTVFLRRLCRTISSSIIGGSSNINIRGEIIEGIHNREAGMNGQFIASYLDEE